MSAIRNADGSVLVDGVRLSATQVNAILSAPPAPPPAPEFRPLDILTFSGRRYGHTGVPRYGIWYSTTTNKWFYLDKGGSCIPGTSWKAKNLSRAKFTFKKPA